jgi:hypothetical protein
VSARLAGSWWGATIEAGTTSGRIGDVAASQPVFTRLRTTDEGERMSRFIVLRGRVALVVATIAGAAR